MGLLGELFLTFAKIGTFTFGGGYAMISMIEASCVEEKQWITQDEMLDITVLAESTPGPIAINCATFTGYKQAGLVGAVVATLGIVIPPFLVIWLGYPFLQELLSWKVLASAFQGIKIGVGLLILDAAVMMLKKGAKTALPRTIIFGSCLAMLCIDSFGLPFSSIQLMLLAAGISLVASGLKKKRSGERGKTGW
ncbi:chromate transporter [Acidaminococcus timonensis]|jgi:chromate transporter|uniref:chromate transporter n=2 Tax=Acidaminococcus timonensis TaxID=1871002 RepID=UPI0008D8E866|nr:chromate transporter [Acidaminococcus timonensis]